MFRFAWQDQNWIGQPVERADRPRYDHRRYEGGGSGTGSDYESAQNQAANNAAASAPPPPPDPFQTAFGNFQDQLNQINPLFLQNAQALGGLAGQYQGLGGQYQGVLGQFQGLNQNLQNYAGSVAGAGQNAFGLAGQAQGAAGNLGNLAGQYQQIAQGNDPRFAQYQQSQLDQSRYNARQNLMQTASFFDEQGLGGTSASLNAQQKLGQQQGLQEQALTGQLGMQQMQRQDTALGQAGNAYSQQVGALGQAGGLYGQGANMYGQAGNLNQAQGQNFSQMGNMLGQYGNTLGAQAGILGGQNDMYNQYLQNASVGPQLQIGWQAAQNAGRVPDSSGGGHGPLGTVLCTLVYERGDLPERIYQADRAYGRLHVTMDEFRGYHFWAKPLAGAAQSKPWLYKLVRPVARAWAYQMAYQMGEAPKANLAGMMLQKLIQPVCGALGKAIRMGRVYQRRYWLAHQS